LNTTVTLLGVAKQIQKLTLLDLKQNRVNYTLTHLNAQTVKEIIKPTPINVLSSDTTLTENDIPRNINQ